MIMMIIMMMVVIFLIGVVLGVDSRLGYWDLVGGGEIRNMVFFIIIIIDIIIIVIIKTQTHQNSDSDPPLPPHRGQNPLVTPS